MSNNNRKKILIVSRSFYPDISPRSFRTTELVKEFARQGHQVTLYTHKKDIHSSIEKEYGVTINDLGELSFPKIDLSRGSGPIKLIKRIIQRGLLMLAEYPDIELMFKVRKALKNLSGFDLMISIAVPHPVHWGVAWARSQSNPIAEKWIADCGDPYMGTIDDSFKKFFYFKYLEKWFCRKADFISIPKIEMRTNYYQEFQDKIVEIPQGFKFEEYRGKDEQIKVLNKIPTFAFAGTFMRIKRNPVPLLQYLAHVQKDFKFIIYSGNPELAVPFVEILKGRLEIRKFIPRTALLQELGNMDFLVNIGYDPVHQAPSKLIDYFLTGRPVLSFSTNSIDEKLVDQFLDGNYEGRFEFNDMDKFRIENVCQRFLDLYGQ
jgi:hypothetical protein